MFFSGLKMYLSALLIGNLNHIIRKPEIKLNDIPIYRKYGTLN